MHDIAKKQIKKTTATINILLGSLFLLRKNMYSGENVQMNGDTPHDGGHGGGGGHGDSEELQRTGR